MSDTEGLEGRLREAVLDVLGKLRPIPERPAYRQIHSRHLRVLAALASAQPATQDGPAEEAQ